MSAPLPVYDLMPIELVRGENCYVWDADGNMYLDLYGGHAVISIGHAHPQWSQAIAHQAATLGYYSNSVRIAIQEQAAASLGSLAQREDCNVFFVNSGAEAIENALKVASFTTGRRRVIAFDGSFHGRTSLAVAATDNPKLRAPINETDAIVYLPLNDLDAVGEHLQRNDVAAVLIEGIQGVGGMLRGSDEFLQGLESLCRHHGTMLILDEIQSGAGRTGKYFAHQHASITPQLITMAKGIGNGFPVGALFVQADIPVHIGMLGTTFGGSHMACAAVQSVATITQRDNLMAHATERGDQLMRLVEGIDGVAEVRGRGLMIGVVLEESCAPARTMLWQKHRILTGSAKDPRILRILPPLTISADQIDQFVMALRDVLRGTR